MQRRLFIAALTASGILLGCIFCPPSTVGQTSNLSQNKIDQTKVSSAKIDPVTLALNLEIPLGSYPGRGGASIPLSISYSSKLWTTQEIPGNDITGIPDQTLAVFANNSMQGWTSSLKVPIVVFTGQFQPFDTYGQSCDGGCSTAAHYIKRMHVYLPDGSAHELRLTDTWATGDPSTQDWTGTYLAVDGSELRYDTSTKTIYMADGARYIVNGAPDANTWSSVTLSEAIRDLYTSTQVATYIDASGNELVYSGSTKQWTDTMGRQFASPLPVPTDTTGTWSHTPSNPAVANVTYTLPGIGTGTLGYTFKWKKLEYAFSSTSYVLNYPGNQHRSSHPTTSPYSPALFAGYVSMAGSVYFDPVVLTEIDLPNGQSYTFGYNPYGEIDKVTYPTGAYEKFSYGTIYPLSREMDGLPNHGVTERRLSVKGDGTDEAVWTYTAGFASTSTYPYTLPYTSVTTNPDGTSEERLVYADNDPANVHSGFDNVFAGKIYETRIKQSTTLLRRTLTDWASTGPLSGGDSYATRDPRPVKEVSILFEGSNSNALASMSESVYDTSGSSDPAYFSSLNTKQAKKYDYVVASATTAAGASLATAEGWFSSASPAVVAESDYLYDSNYKSRNINGLVTESRIKDASGNLKAKTQFTYDESGYQTTSSGTMPSAASGSWSDPTSELGSTIGAKRGKVTTARSYYDIASSLYIDTHSFYDQYGNVRKTRDGRGNDAEVQYDYSYAFTYPTSSITPIPDSTGTNGSSTAFTTTRTYDYNTGLQLTTTDANGQTTTTAYSDSLLRPTMVTGPDGHETTSEYGDTPGSLYVKVSSQIDSTNWKVGYKYLDNLARPIKSQEVNSISGDVFVDTEYDNMGRAKKTTNPYHTGDTTLWTENTFDGLGRITSVATPDTAHVDTAFDLATSGSLIGTTVTATDQAGKLRRSVTNALGQLIRVDEPNSSNALGSISSPNQDTDYTYDLLNNFTTVTQGSQTRTFTYDALSRLKSAANPESGTVNYTYDANNNLATKADARSIITTYTYDSLNRVIARSYSDGTTPAVSYYYDNITNGKGKLRKVTSSVSTTEYTSFDILGRVTGHKQTIGGTDYTTAYTYNLGGAMLEETYPSGRMVRNTLNADADLSQVETKPSGGSYTTRASNFVYNAAGAATSLQLGNSKYENTVFNSRLQPTQIGLGTSTTDTSLLKLEYTYNTTGNYDNNGNILTQKITVPGMTYPLIQTYSYDSLNRLASATETSNSAQTWKQTFTYDRYGNRRFDEANTSMPSSFSNQAVSDPTISTSTNHLTSSGYNYDSSGNTTYDASLRKFTYDAENKQIKVESTNSSQTVTGTLGEYNYDGDGKRVKKYNTSTGDNIIFLYDAAGKLIEERNTSGTLQTSYVYAGSRLLSTETAATSATTYLTADSLGSPRINTDGSGNVIARHDYHPFGEEIGGVGGRTTGLNYGSDAIRKQFTGYERDGETGIDFAQARYCSNSLGRFNSTDPLYLELRRLVSPQQMNLYVYARNNPLQYIDPIGLDVEVKGKDADKFVSDLNNRKGAKFQVEKGEDGKLKIIDKDKVDASKLSDGEKALYNAITDTEHHATLTGVPENGFFDYDSACPRGIVGLNIVDASDMDKLRNASAAAAGEVIAHAVLESYSSAKTGSTDYDKNHAFAQQYFPGAEQGPKLTVKDDGGKDDPRTEYQASDSWKRIGVTVNNTYKFVTPVPRKDFDKIVNSNDRIPANIVSIEKK